MTADQLPPHRPGQRIGLLGGSFNPPHAAHRAISLHALERLALDRVWWLVTPGNPLKDTRGLPPLPERLAAAQALADHPAIDVTGIEAIIGTSYTCETVAWLKEHCPGVHFVWIMGADILPEFHRWKDWRGIADALPIAVMDRGGFGPEVLATPAVQALTPYRLPEADAGKLAATAPPAWVFLHGLKLPLSSTALRNSAASGG